MDPQLVFLLFIAVLLLLLVFRSRSQKRAIAELQLLQSSLTEGDRVMTTSGLHAVVVSAADEKTVELEIAPGVRTTWVRAAIREKLTASGEEFGDPPAQLNSPHEDHARTDQP